MSDNYAKVKSRKYASDDDAENLLAGILDETEDEARKEQERIEAELRAKKEDERRRKDAAARAKKEEAAAKLSAEMERLQKVEQRRTEKLEALKIEELKERGEWIDPEEERRKLEAKLAEEAEVEAMKKAAEEKARRKAAAAHADSAIVPTMGAPDTRKTGGSVAVMGGIVIALVAVVGIGAAVVLGGYQLDQATYSKAVFAPKEQQVALVEKSSTPIPKPEPVAISDADDSSASSDKRDRRPRRVAKRDAKPSEPSKPISTKPQQNEGNKKAKELESMLDTDIFGGGL